MALAKAIIINLESNEQFPVLFNPEEYTLETGNSFAEIGIPGLAKSPIQYVRGNLRTLKMELFFDTYERTPYELKDVRAETRRITSLLEKNATTQAPPVLLFTWGSLQFKCVLESASQRFIMFLNDGTPVRARLNVTFKEFEQVEVEVQQGFFLGPPTVRNILEGDTLVKLAHEYLGDPGAWRDIAMLNNLDNPLVLPLGLALIIPPSKTKTRN
jgi:nucleoid-associated protein YgaU